MLIALACCLALAAIALAAGKVESKVTLELGPEPGHFSGTVKAEDAACTEGRKVRIIRDTPPPKETVGSDRTNLNGRYSLHSDEQSGSWYARVRPETIAGTFCKGDRSTVHSAG
jgi:hypothetical protein